MQATKDLLPGLVADVESDTRNVLLSLARIWRTVETNEICSKVVAANWALEKLPKKYKPVMTQARDICIGKVEESWKDYLNLTKPCAVFMLSQINQNLQNILFTKNTREISIN